MKIITIVGARPQFIKAAAVSRAIRESGKNIQELIVHTGQHFDANMSDIFFDQMEIPKPDYHLNINGLSHGAMTGQMLEKIEEVLLSEKPDYVLVYGDTNSTIAGALAAKKLHIKTVHVEAGLRSFNMKMPEEVNRILTDRISDILFCPTSTAVENLKKEGFDNISASIEQVGDVMEDAAMYYAEKKEQFATIMKQYELSKDPFVLATVHRAENTDDKSRLTAIVESLNEVNEKTRVVLPLHPRTKKYIEQFGLKPRFTLIDPVGYFDMIDLLSHTQLVMTDSGGLQKEAYFFNKYCITLRDETEWVELINYGYNFLAGADQKKIVSLANELLNKPFNRQHELYGGGKAASRIVEILSHNNKAG